MPQHCASLGNKQRGAQQSRRPSVPKGQFSSWGGGAPTRGPQHYDRGPWSSCKQCFHCQVTADGPNFSTNHRGGSFENVNNTQTDFHRPRGHFDDRTTTTRRQKICSTIKTILSPKEEPRLERTVKTANSPGVIKQGWGQGQGQGSGQETTLRDT